MLLFRNCLTILLLFVSVNIYSNSAKPYSADFIDYIKVCENGIRSGWINNRWYPHDVLGIPHIGYGHRIVKGEDFSKGLTEEQAQNLLIADLQRAERQAAQLLLDRYRIDWNALPRYKKEIFIDYQFNGVLRSFPKFTIALLNDDHENMIKEYKRYVSYNGKRIELKDRNQRFSERYLKCLF